MDTQPVYMTVFMSVFVAAGVTYLPQGGGLVKRQFATCWQRPVRLLCLAKLVKGVGGLIWHPAASAGPVS
jgi:hypothetical protein